MIKSNLKKVALILSGLLVLSPCAWAHSPSIALSEKGTIANFLHSHVGHYIQENSNGTYQVSCRAINWVTTDKLVSYTGNTSEGLIKYVDGRLNEAKARCAQVEGYYS